MSEFEPVKPAHIPPEIAAQIAKIPLQYITASLANSPETLEHFYKFFDLPTLIKALIVRAASEGKVTAALLAFQDLLAAENILEYKHSQRMESIKNYGWHFESNTITFVNETIGLTPMQAQLFGALQRGVCATYGAQKGYCYPVFLTEELEKIITSTDFASEGNYVENLVSHIRKKFREVYSVLIHTPEADQIYFPWISTIIKQGFQLKLLPRAELIAEVQSFDMRAVPKRSSEPDYVATNFKYTDATTGVGLNLAEQYIFYQSYKIVLLPEEVVVMRLLFDKRGTLLTQNYILDALCQELGTDVIHKSTMSIWNTQLKRNLHSFALQMQRAGATKFLSIHSVHGRNGGLALTTTDDLSSLEAFMSPPPPQESPCNRKKIETHNKIISPLAIIKTFSILNPCQKQQRQNPQ